MSENKLDCLLGKFNLKEAQQFIEKMPYDYETANVKGKYRVSSPNLTLERRSAMCMDGALLGAALTNIRPKIMGLEFGRGAPHAILITEDSKNELYGAIGKSTVDFREQKYHTHKELAQSYKQSLAFHIAHIDSQVRDWKTTKKDMPLMIHWSILERTKDFSIFYFLNSYLRNYTRVPGKIRSRYI